LTFTVLASVILIGRASVLARETSEPCTAAVLTRGCLATAERYTAQAAAYAARQQRGFYATGARYAGIAAAYSEAAISRERAAKAETARFDGLTADFAVRRFRGLMISGMRYSGMAARHAGVRRARAAYTARLQGQATAAGYAAGP
jgi:hypothetical protein